MKDIWIIEWNVIIVGYDRAQLSDPRFKLVDGNGREVAIICTRLDGILLAIELVASLTRYIEPATMLERLSGR